MKKIYMVDTGDDLIEGAFDEEGNIIDYWSPTDACWREYFDPMLKKLGIEVVYPMSDELELKLRQIAVDDWGISPEDAGLED